eukprot:11228291-Lingulodinium_polyedra.AAC.1
MLCVLRVGVCVVRVGACALRECVGNRSRGLRVGVCVLAVRVGNIPLHYSCVDSQGTATIALRARQTRQHGVNYFQPAVDDLECFTLFHVTDFEEIDAVNVEWRSPLHNALANNTGFAGIWAEQIGDVASAKAVVARLGFSTLSDAAIAKLCDFWGVARPDSFDAFETLTALIKMCLPSITDDELYEILAQRRLSRSTEVAEIVLEMQDCFGKESADVNKWAEQEIKHAESEKPFAEKLKKLYASTRAARDLAASKGKGKGKSKGRRGKDRNPPVAAEVPSEALSEEDARRLCPGVESMRIYRDENNRRWLGYIFKKSLSRSWAIHGDLKASAIVVYWMWCEFEKVSGQSCPHEWLAALAKGA